MWNRSWTRYTQPSENNWVVIDREAADLSDRNTNPIIQSYCYQPANCRNPVDRCASLGSCTPQIFTNLFIVSILKYLTYFESNNKSNLRSSSNRLSFWIMQFLKLLRMIPGVVPIFTLLQRKPLRNLSYENDWWRLCDHSFASNWVHFHQMASVASFSISGSEKEGKGGGSHFSQKYLATQELLHFPYDEFTATSFETRDLRDGTNIQMFEYEQVYLQTIRTWLMGI